MDEITVVLTGNPNSGKTTLFNYLTGSTQHVGNWGGVTVEIKSGYTKVDGRRIKVIDLPGTYSLSTYSMEERVARDFIVGEHPDIVIDVLDSTNLSRNLYLTVQLMELGIRPLLAFNMWDEVESKGLSIDIEALSHLFDCPAVETVGKSGVGARKMLQKAVEMYDKKIAWGYSRNSHYIPSELEKQIKELSKSLVLGKQKKFPKEWVAGKLFENDAQIEEYVAELEGGSDVLSERDSRLLEVERIFGDDAESIIAESRYGFISGAVRETVKNLKPNRVEISDKIDSILTHPFWAYPVFIVFMWLLFQATFRIGAYPMSWIDTFFVWLGNFVGAVLPAGDLNDLLVNGVIGGVGGVIVFLPNILILFLGISIMEDSGYMARSAFIMDKFMHKIGLHGKSFIPMLMGMGCSVPAIMAARTLESKNDRIKTILLTPLISCSARLPLYVLFAGALFPHHAGTIVFLFQFVFGAIAFMIVGIVFKHTLFKDEEFPFVMELPPYRLPTVRSVLIHMWQKAEHYLKKMGTVVLLFSIILWFAVTFPKSPDIKHEYDKKIETVLNNNQLTNQERSNNINQLKAECASNILGNTIAGRTGKLMEPLVRPLGFDWRGAVSLITGFIAKEAVVGSMGVLYSAGDDQNGDSLRKKVADNFTTLSGLAFMFFMLLYTPCIVTVVTIIKELKSWKWSVFSVAYQTGLAWFVAFIIYQGGKIIGFN